MSATQTVRFSRALYAGEAVDEALKRFGGVAAFERDEDDLDWIVVVSPKRPGAAWLRRVCGEVQNYALGLTVRRGEQAESSTGVDR